MSTIFGNIVLDFHTFGTAVSSGVQVAVFALCLVGLPMVLMGLLGVGQQQESYVRAFLFFMIVSFAVDFAFIVFMLLLQDPCGALHSLGADLTEALGFGRGAAISCGASRFLSWSIVIAVTA